MCVGLGCGMKHGKGGESSSMSPFTREISLMSCRRLMQLLELGGVKKNQSFIPMSIDKSLSISSFQGTRNVVFWSFHFRGSFILYTTC